MQLYHPDWGTLEAAQKGRDLILLQLTAGQWRKYELANPGLKWKSMLGVHEKVAQLRTKVNLYDPKTDCFTLVRGLSQGDDLPGRLLLWN